MAKRKQECYLCLEQVGERCYACWQPALFDYYWLWSFLLRQDTASIIRQLESIFYDQGPPAEILTDNSTAFSSEQFSQFLRKWGVWLQFQCAYVPAGNSIVEGSHQSIKVIAARKQSSVPEVVYWYNATLKDSVSPSTAPANVMHANHLGLRGINIAMAPCNMREKYRIGDVVWVKTPHSKCTDKLRMGHVISPQSVQVDGMPCHVKNLQPVIGSKPSSDDESDSEDSVQLVYLKLDPLGVAQTSALYLQMPMWPAVLMQMAAQRTRVHPRTKPLSSCSGGVPSRRGLFWVALCTIMTGGTRWIWKSATLCLCGHPDMSSMQVVYMWMQSPGRHDLLSSWGALWS